MSLNLVPDYKFDTFDKVTPEFLLAQGIRCVLLDIDNTLEPYENDKPGTHVLAWFDSLRANGISYAIISNNNRDRVLRFTEGQAIIAYSSSCKPFAGKLNRAMKDLGVEKCETLFIGDQLFTDVWAAHNAGIRAVVVPPIRDKRDPLTRLKRLLERPFMRAYDRRRKE